jgi:predicted transcriptional regulator of viral defense system
MRDNRPDRSCLEQLAYSQDGYFTARDAAGCGFSPQLLYHHVRSGRLERERRGLYRLRNYPTSTRTDVRAKWLACGPESVVSHESALDLLGLTDVVPDEVHITVPRRRRGLRVPQGVLLHTTARLNHSDIVWRDGIPVTAPARSIAESAGSGTAPEQVDIAVAQALSRGLATARQLREAAGESRVMVTIERAIARIPTAP